ncbi:ATP synthase F1 subunit delta, partial [Chloroflexota bacterium]
VAKGMVGIAEQLVIEYERLADTYRGIGHAEVTTAIQLDPKDKEALSSQLSALTDKKMVLSTEVDPDIMGGIIVRIGDKLIDGSTRGRLEALRKDLIKIGR